MLPIVEGERSLLFYPSQYEGQESSPNIFYTGATPHQQAVPAVNYLRTLGHRRFFLVGSDQIYSRTTNAVLKGYLASLGIAGDMVVERYVPAEFAEWRTLVEDIRRFAKGKHASIIATITGDANLRFFRELARQHVTAETIPVMSLSINEAELPALMRSNMTGHMVAWSYLHAVDRKENRAFIADWRRFSGQAKAMTNDSMEATWIGFNLWSRGGRSRRHDRGRQGARRARRPPYRRAERLHAQDGRQDPPPLQAGHDRAHQQGRAHRSGLGDRGAGAARALEPVAGRGPIAAAG